MQQTQEGPCQLRTWPGGVHGGPAVGSGEAGLTHSPHIPSSPLFDKRPVEEHGLRVRLLGMGVGSAVCSWEPGPEPSAVVPPVTFTGRSGLLHWYTCNASLGVVGVQGTGTHLSFKRGQLVRGPQSCWLSRLEAISTLPVSQLEGGRAC